MTIHHSDPWLTIHGGDCRDVLATLPAESVHCVVTSPPYWGLRDYGTATWDGGDPACDHRIPATGSTQNKFADRCGKCGAVRVDRQLGLEATPEEYVADMVAVFREVRRVLRDDGTLWLNLGDSYASTTSGNGGYSEKSTLSGFTSPDTKGRRANESGARHRINPSLKPKDLVGIPWRVAFALQADGWYLRSDIIWAKPNPMPESVTDRPTKAHEYLFLLTKSARYFYDADAVREPLGEWSQQALTANWSRKQKQTPGGQSPQGFVPERGQGNGYGDSINPAGRNRRTVWTVATQPYPGAHFAVMPEALVEPCILAGCPEGGTVLDPLGGSGTVARVANRLSRRAILIDLNPDYLAQQLERNRDMPLGLTA